MRRQLTTLIAGAGVAATALVGLTAPAQAAPSAKGTTTVAPSDLTLGVLGGVLRPASLTDAGAVFPVVGNPCDGTIEHVGGLRLDTPASGTLDLRNFTIDTTVTPVTVSAIVDGGDRVDVFTVGEGGLLFTAAASAAVVGDDSIAGEAAGVPAIDVRVACR